MSDSVTVKVDGQVFEGWKAIGVQRSIDTLCAGFRLTLYNAAIFDRAACEIWVGDELLITGRVDRVAGGVGKTYSVGGRDKTLDLVDASAVHSPGAWRGQKLEKIGAELLAPFGLTLTVETATGAVFPLFCIEPGETVFEALTRMCRMRGLMIRTDPKGSVIVFAPRQKRTGMVLELGRNLTGFEFDINSADRFSEYIIKGQRQGGAHTEAKDAAAPKGSAKDAGVTRYRPKLIVSDEQSTPAGLRTRALWEATTRRAQALQVGGSVKGWRDDAGALFEPDTLVRLIADDHGLDLDMTLTEVTFTLDDKGTSTRFRMTKPEAFTTVELLEADAKKKKKAKKDPDALYKALSEG
ncbi:bacteriophage Mu P family protein [Asticcacaulis biprosthecium C19]|uniref:Bacteriophage Mu P family protein n=1 Tax=Asticcacaulis biprosthecium C19 TaxID=715226 RepID=F4QG88_9CAUL|nr:hypothetical protein [Asticcacaulis biprosthecium]EGF92416.1 bacteriophage Mu P family protein [Asticcacaulis biprosthecium C19]